MDYDEIKMIVAKYLKDQSELLPSQKILQKLFSLLSKSRHYIDYCTEIKGIFENNIEVFLLAEIFFLDCSIVFQEQSILKLAILLDNDTKTISIEKFFNILNSEDVKKFNIVPLVINNCIKVDRKELKKIRLEFVNFKNKRDKEIVHIDKSNIKNDYIVCLDMNSLFNIQSRTYNLIDKYFELLNLPKPSSLMDYSSLDLLTGLDIMKNVLFRGLTELDFNDNERIQKIIKTTEFVKKFKNHSS